MFPTVYGSDRQGGRSGPVAPGWRFPNGPRLPVFLGRHGLTIVEVLIVAALLSFILMVAYRVFFSQAKMVSQSIEFLQVNDSFRKIGMILGNDIREANSIEFPEPIHIEKVGALTTKTGMILKLLKDEIDPSLPPTSSPLGQIAARREIIYELKPNPNPMEKNIPRFKLMRTEFLGKEKQTREIVGNIRDFIIHRTLRKPMKPLNVSGLKDQALEPIPSYLNGTGNDVVHVSVTVERTRVREQGQVYQISMSSSYYKRGKEVWANQ